MFKSTFTFEPNIKSDDVLPVLDRCVLLANEDHALNPMEAQSAVIHMSSAPTGITVECSANVRYDSLIARHFYAAMLSIYGSQCFRNIILERGHGLDSSEGFLEPDAAAKPGDVSDVVKQKATAKRKRTNRRSRVPVVAAPKRRLLSKAGFIK